MGFGIDIVNRVVDTIEDKVDETIDAAQHNVDRFRTTVSDRKDDAVEAARQAGNDVHHFGLDHSPEYRAADGIVQDVRHEATEPDGFDPGSIFASGGIRVVQGIFDRFAGNTPAGSTETVRFSELDGETQKYVKDIYGDSIEYEEIRIESGGAIADNEQKAPHVVGNVIYVSSEFLHQENDGTYSVTGEHIDTFGHEVGHVWQNQNGGGDYAHQGLIAQARAVIDDARENGEIDIEARNDAYKGVEALSSGVAFENLNPEEQADVAGRIGQLLHEGKPLTAELAAAHISILNGDGAPV